MNHSRKFEINIKYMLKFFNPNRIKNPPFDSLINYNEFKASEEEEMF